MALFVAKLFETTFAADTSPIAVVNDREDSVPASTDSGDAGDRESPPIVSASTRVLSHRITREKFSRKLHRMYSANTQRHIRENIENAREKLVQAWVPQEESATLRVADPESLELMRMAEPETSYDSSSMDLVEYIASSRAKLESVVADISRQAEAKKLEDERIRQEMEYEVQNFFKDSKLDKISREIQRMNENVSLDVFLTHRTDLCKGEFLEGVLRVNGLTGASKKLLAIGDCEENIDKYLCESQKILKRLNELVEGIGSSNCLRILTSRFAIVMNEFCAQLVGQLEIREQRKDAYRILQKYRNRKFSIEEKLLEPWMKKFEYHFVRDGSALNQLDKPEWPLRWFVETAKELKLEFEDLNCDLESLFVQLAKDAKEYFETHRWALIEDPSNDVFSFYLSTYLDFARQVRDEMGEMAMTTCMSGFARDAETTKNGWQLIDEWVRHDRRYFEMVLDDVKDPFSPSKIDPSINEIAQTLLDMLSACKTRLEPLVGNPGARKEFIMHCCDEIVRSYVVHAVRIEIETGVDKEKRSLFAGSVMRIKHMVDQYDLVSIGIRKTLGDLINELE